MHTNDRIIQLKEEENLPFSKIAEIMGMSYNSVRGRYRRRKDKYQVPDESSKHLGVSFLDVVNALKQGPQTLHDLSKRFDRSEDTLSNVITKMRDSGYSIIEDMNAITIPLAPAIEVEVAPLFSKDKVEFDFSFALISDTHSGSRCEQVSSLREFSKIAVDAGCKIAVHTGDAVAGIGVYRGQEMDVYCSRGQDQAEAAANNLPDVFDKIYMLGGNHDHSFYRRSGLDVRLEIVARDRPDIELVSYDAFDLPLISGVDARLWHPTGGPAYAISYKGQKYSEQLAAQELFEVVLDEKPAPTILFVLIGHFHKMFSFFQGPINIIGSGSFEGETSYLKRKGWIPQIGGVIVKCKVVDGYLHQVTTTNIQYKEIENDWRYWWYKRQPKTELVIEKVFTYPE